MLGTCLVTHMLDKFLIRKGTSYYPSQRQRLDEAGVGEDLDLMLQGIDGDSHASSTPLLAQAIFLEIEFAAILQLNIAEVAPALLFAPFDLLGPFGKCGC